MTKKLHGQRMSPEWEEFHRRSGKKAKRLCLLGMILFLLIVLSAAIGASSVDLNIVVTVLKDCITGSTEASSVQHSIVMGSRLPRIFAAVFTGGALSLAGLLMQGIFRNPLVSPYTLGVSNAASFGACVAIVLGYYVTELNFIGWLIPAFAFASAVLTRAINKDAGFDRQCNCIPLLGTGVWYQICGRYHRSAGIGFLADGKLNGPFLEGRRAPTGSAGDQCHNRFGKGVGSQRYGAGKRGSFCAGCKLSPHAGNNLCPGNASHCDSGFLYWSYWLCRAGCAPYYQNAAGKRLPI